MKGWESFTAFDTHPRAAVPTGWGLRGHGQPRIAGSPLQEPSCSYFSGFLAFANFLGEYQ